MSKNSDAAASLAVGDAVVFTTAGRGGVSPERKGAIKSFRESTRGTWVVLVEEGAAEGVEVSTRAAAVKKQ